MKRHYRDVESGGGGKGPFIYYVSTFLGFLDPPFLLKSLINEYSLKTKNNT